MTELSFFSAIFSFFLFFCKKVVLLPPEKKGKKWVFGEMAEWSKAHAWKVCRRRKRLKGSNPFLSAKKGKIIQYNNNKTTKTNFIQKTNQ